MVIHCIIQAAPAFRMLGWRYIYKNRWGTKSLPGGEQDKWKRHNLSCALRYDESARPKNGRWEQFTQRNSTERGKCMISHM